MEETIKQKRGLKVLFVVLVLAISFIINLAWSMSVASVYSIILAAKGVADFANPQLMVEAMYKDISLLMFTSMYNLAAIAVVFLFWRYLDKRKTEELGFGFTNKTMAQILWGIVTAVAAVLLIAVFGSVFGFISFEGYGSELYNWAQISSSLLMGVITFLMVGFGEEAVYRAYIQKHIVEMVGNKLGLIVAAFIFMVVHLITYGKLLDLFDVFLAGIILGYAYMLTRSIYLPAAFHFMWDLLQVNIFRLQDYEYYKGPVLILFQNSGDLIINNFNLGNRLELVFILVEIVILLLMYVFREKLKKLAQ